MRTATCDVIVTYHYKYCGQQPRSTDFSRVDYTISTKELWQNPKSRRRQTGMSYEWRKIYCTLLSRPYKRPRQVASRGGALSPPRGRMILIRRGCSPYWAPPPPPQHSLCWSESVLKWKISSYPSVFYILNTFYPSDHPELACWTTDLIGAHCQAASLYKYSCRDCQNARRVALLVFFCGRKS